jgi:hypothetical protein
VGPVAEYVYIGAEYQFMPSADVKKLVDRAAPESIFRNPAIHLTPFHPISVTEPFVGKLLTTPELHTLPSSEYAI